MKLVANIQLKPNRQQAQALRETLERCNTACNWISEQAFATQTLKQFALQKLVYKSVRERFDLAAQVAVRCVAKVAEAYKAGTEGRRTFRKHGAQPYDDRIFRFRDDNTISLWTTSGRLTIPFVCGERQRKLLAYRKGEVDLMFVRGKWYIACVCDVAEPDEIDVKDVLGVDLGIVNLAFDSDGESNTGDKVEQTRRQYAHRHRNLRKKRTKSARRKLKSLAGRQARFQKDTNHRISKAIVAKAQRSAVAIALEDLQGIRARVKARRRQRARLHNWPFFQLRSFLEFKARLAGVPVILVDPRNTSRECPACGHVEKRNRLNQSTFSCVSCG